MIFSGIYAFRLNSISMSDLIGNHAAPGVPNGMR